MALAHLSSPQPMSCCIFIPAGVKIIFLKCPVSRLNLAEMHVKKSADRERLFLLHKPG